MGHLLLQFIQPALLGLWRIERRDVIRCRPADDKRRLFGARRLGNDVDAIGQPHLAHTHARLQFECSSGPGGR